MTYAHQRKRAKANRRGRSAKTVQAQAEGVYVHPSPFDTNDYWHEEMVLGPGPPPRKGNRDKNKTDSTRRLNTSGQGSSSAGRSSADTTLVVQSFDGTREEEGEYEGEGWNRKRYQRADELLWGQDDPNIPSYLSFGSSAAGRPVVTRNGTYYGSRNPAVNDLHPPVVSTHPTHPDQTRWMLQPPPPVKVMEGKERANRSRSTSAASYNNSSRGTGGAIAGRQASTRRPIEERKARDFTMITKRPPAHRGPSPSSNAPQGQRHDRESWSSSESEGPIITPSKKKRPPPIRAPDRSKTDTQGPL
ncbi:MAG: hypothetical protein LQ340_004303 [Diploschistes diacapsis]|nr:MAG: hypothetical protein LQ340_004303 [Diploschistes diacapsis]